MNLWSCLFLGGPLHGQYHSVQRGLACRVLSTLPKPSSWAGRWAFLASDPWIAMGEPETYTPVRFRLPGWRVLVWVYLHSSMTAGAPAIPTGTVLPGSVLRTAVDADYVCRVCYGQPIPGYTFCSRTTAGVMHAMVAAEMQTLELL